ncbi:MAG: class I SAM-dependent methyltransferase, partial [Aquihabitans sp.]
MADDIDLWEAHSDWWQDGFTEGADPEYEEQILPLAANLLDGYDRILDVGTGEGQVARLVAAQGS